MLDEGEKQLEVEQELEEDDAVGFRLDSWIFLIINTLTGRKLIFCYPQKLKLIN